MIMQQLANKNNMVIDNKDNCILSISYFPPIQYLSKFLLFNNVLIEKYENFSKQSYRNRCNIYGANGKLTLIIPVKKEDSLKVKITEVRIDYDTNWQKLHFKSIESAYRHSPFYEYYIDDFLHVFNKKHKFLFDLNIEILIILLKLIEIDTKFPFTDKYNASEKIESNDYRNSIHPKQREQKPDVYFSAINYYQVFQEKHNFISNLSIIDLLFNEGPNTKNILNQSIKKT